MEQGVSYFAPVDTVLLPHRGTSLVTPHMLMAGPIAFGMHVPGTTNKGELLDPARGASAWASGKL